MLSILIMWDCQCCLHFAIIGQPPRQLVLVLKCAIADRTLEVVMILWYRRVNKVLCRPLYYGRAVSFVRCHAFHTLFSTFQLGLLVYLRDHVFSVILFVYILWTVTLFRGILAIFSQANHTLILVLGIPQTGVFGFVSAGLLGFWKGGLLQLRRCINFFNCDAFLTEIIFFTIIIILLLPILQ